jgi:hypothetical protein
MAITEASSHLSYYRLLRFAFDFTFKDRIQSTYCGKEFIGGNPQYNFHLLEELSVVILVVFVEISRQTASRCIVCVDTY